METGPFWVGKQHKSVTNTHVHERDRETDRDRDRMGEKRRGRERGRQKQRVEERGRERQRDRDRTRDRLPPVGPLAKGSAGTRTQWFSWIPPPQGHGRVSVPSVHARVSTHANHHCVGVAQD